MKKVRMSNGEFATCLEDFEDVMVRARKKS